MKQGTFTRARIELGSIGMCKYCEGEYGTELLIRNEKSVGIYAPESQLELLKDAGDGRWQIVIDSKKINYCPVCGRRLNKEN